MTDPTGVDEFWAKGFRVVDDLLTPQQCAFLRQAMDVSQRSGQMRYDENPYGYTGPNAEYSPIAAQMMLKSLVPRISALTGRSLLPGYSYWRIYEHGADLKRHRDREASEISISIAVANEPAGSAWPISLTDFDGVDHHVPLQPGAGVLFLGSKLKHWREPFTGDRQYQLLLFFVDADGPSANLVHDEGRALIP